MADIAMCQNDKCPSFNICYRARAVPNPYRQSYGNFTPKEGEDQCDNFTRMIKEWEDNATN